MKVLFFYRGIESIGTEYLMSYLKMKGHTVGLIFDPGLDDNLFLKLKFVRRLNINKYLLKKAIDFNPDIIAVSIPTNLYPFVKVMISILKQELNVPVIAGGPHVTALPEYVLQNEHIDMVCIGEGEEAFAELLEKMKRGLDIYDTKNIWFKKDGQIIRNDIRDLIQDLDNLPFPDKSFFYDQGCFYDHLEMVTGRGCPFQCTFCNIHFQRKLFSGKGRFVRRRSVSNVLAEIKMHLNLYDIKSITFHDDTFTADIKWIEEFSDRYRKEIGIPFYCFAYPTTVNKGMINLLKNANCTNIFMGMDSGDPDVRTNLLKRPMSDDRIITSAKLIREARIHLQLSAIFGFPGETAESMWKTVRMIDRIRPEVVSGYIFYPFPKTELHEYAVEKGYLDEKGIELVKSGEGGYHHDSLLKNPFNKLAVSMAKLLPIYNKSPEMFKSLISKMMTLENTRLALFIYLVTIPITYRFLGMEGIKVTVRMAIRAFKLRNKPAG